MTVVLATSVILRDVREVCEIIGVLAGAMDVTYLVFANWLLSSSDYLQTNIYFYICIFIACAYVIQLSVR